MTYVKGEAHIDEDFTGEDWEDDIKEAIMLPHSCDQWVIGDADDARQMIKDLEVLIVELEAKQ